ncbi:MAG: hypothetical protein IPN19_07440 [Elusimicrobia bacterium]|nr:hypothetical protein [Elusimicrobiota bacterium]
MKPVGLDFDRLAVGMTMEIQAPVTIEGFGKLLCGDMTFKGTAKTPEGTKVGKFQFQGASVRLDNVLGETLGLSSPANLIRATFVVESAVMNLKSAEVQSKDKRLFVQESKPVIDLNQVEKKLTAVGGGLAEAQGQFTKADRDFSNGAVASRSLLTNIARATGQTDVAVFQEPDDLKSLRQEANSLGVLSSQVTENMKVGNYQEVAEALPDLTVRTEVFKARSETLTVQAEMTKGFFKEIRTLTTDLSAVNKVVDVGDLVGKPITMEAAAKGYEWFPAPEKKVFADRASHAQETLVTLVEAGAVDADRALDWALSIKIAKDKVLGAGPGKLSDRISVAAAHPQATLKEASSEAADFYVFNTLSTYAETSPQTMMAVGYVGLGATKVSNALGKAAGVGLMVVFPVSSVSGFAAGFVADQGLQAAGVNEDLSGFMGITSGMLVGGRVATSKRVASLEKGWAARTGANQRIAQAVQGFKAGFKEIMQGTQKVAQGEAGHVLVGPPVAIKALGVAGKSQTPASPQAQNLTPEIKPTVQDPNAVVTPLPVRRYRLHQRPQILSLRRREIQLRNSPSRKPLPKPLWFLRRRLARRCFNRK